MGSGAVRPADLKAALLLHASSGVPLLRALLDLGAVSEQTLGYLLSLYVGFFLFMGATDLLPEAHRHPSRLRVALTGAGFAAIFVVATLARD